MIEKSFLDAIPSILEYKLYGLITVVLLIIFSLLIYLINKDNPKIAVIKIIKLFIYVSLAMFISFLMFQYFNKPIAKEWSIGGNIELKDYNNKILHKILKDKCGNSLNKSITIEKFLENNLKIIVLPNLPYKSFISSHFTAKIPEHLGTNNLKILFEIDGFHCISDNCQMKLNNTNYNPELKIIFIQDKPDIEECTSLSTIEPH